MDILVAHIQTADISAMREFYGTKLGFPTQLLPNGELKVDCGNTYLMVSQAPDGSEPWYHFAFNIPQNQVEAAGDFLKGRGIEPLVFNDAEIVHFDHWNADAVFFHDPAGNIVEFIARHTLDNEEPGPFTIDSVINMSEMGLPVKDVLDFQDVAKTKFGWPIYGDGGAQFAAVGDENGLLIVVPEGRGWFPTRIPAEPHPVELLIYGGKSGLWESEDGFFEITCEGRVEY